LTTNADWLIDVGCGYGDLSLELASKGKNVVLLDIDKKRLLIAKNRFQKFGLDGEFVCGDAHKLPFPDNVFDVSFSNLVIEHVADPVKILLEKLRVSRLKAVVICTNSFSLPGTRFTYYRLLARKKPETVPNIGVSTNRII